MQCSKLVHSNSYIIFTKIIPISFMSCLRSSCHATVFSPVLISLKTTKFSIGNPQVDNPQHRSDRSRMRKNPKHPSSSRMNNNSNKTPSNAHQNSRGRKNKTAASPRIPTRFAKKPNSVYIRGDVPAGSGRGDGSGSLNSPRRTTNKRKPGCSAREV